MATRVYLLLIDFRSTHRGDSAPEDSSSRLKNKSIFVTVGTTRFDQLVETFNDIDFQNVLVRLGYNRVVFQIGRGDVLPRSQSDLSYEFFAFTDDFEKELRVCELVVSHAGAGTCLEVCRASRRLVVVVNDLLMHNHQSELAEKLSERGHCLYSSCRDLSALFTSNASILGAGVQLADVFTQFTTDYYRNVAKDVEALFF